MGKIVNFAKWVLGKFGGAIISWLWTNPGKGTAMLTPVAGVFTWACYTWAAASWTDRFFLGVALVLCVGTLAVFVKWVVAKLQSTENKPEVPVPEQTQSPKQPSTTWTRSIQIICLTIVLTVLFWKSPTKADPDIPVPHQPVGKEHPPSPDKENGQGRQDDPSGLSQIDFITAMVDGKPLRAATKQPGRARITIRISDSSRTFNLTKALGQQVSAVNDLRLLRKYEVISVENSYFYLQQRGYWDPQQVLTGDGSGTQESGRVLYHDLAMQSVAETVGEEIRKVLGHSEAKLVSYGSEVSHRQKQFIDASGIDIDVEL